MEVESLTVNFDKLEAILKLCTGVTSATPNAGIVAHHPKCFFMLFIKPDDPIVVTVGDKKCIVCGNVAHTTFGPKPGQ